MNRHRAVCLSHFKYHSLGRLCLDSCLRHPPLPLVARREGYWIDGLHLLPQVAPGIA